MTFLTSDLSFFNKCSLLQLVATSGKASPNLTGSQEKPVVSAVPEESQTQPVYIKSGGCVSAERQSHLHVHIKDVNCERCDRNSKTNTQFCLAYPGVRAGHVIFGFVYTACTQSHPYRYGGGPVCRWCGADQRAQLDDAAH